MPQRHDVQAKSQQANKYVYVQSKKLATICTGLYVAPCMRVNAPRRVNGKKLAGASHDKYETGCRTRAYAGPWFVYFCKGVHQQDGVAWRDSIGT